MIHRLAWAVCWLLPALNLAARLDVSRPRVKHPDAPVAKRRGVSRIPRLDIVRTSSVWEAETWFSKWDDGAEFGLVVACVPTKEPAFLPERVTSLAISRERQVLIFDLRPFFRPIPQPLPGIISNFLQDKHRLFFGLGLLQGAARLAFEFDCVIRCVDLSLRKWTQLKLGGGLPAIAKRHLRIAYDPEELVKKRHSLLPGRTWLQWALADHFSRTHGPPSANWTVTMVEMYGVGPVHLKVPYVTHDWTEARREWLQILHTREEARQRGGEARKQRSEEARKQRSEEARKQRGGGRRQRQAFAEQTPSSAPSTADQRSEEARKQHGGGRRKRQTSAEQPPSASSAPPTGNDGEQLLLGILPVIDELRPQHPSQGVDLSVYMRRK